MTMITRQEHLDWCKQRALEYCDSDDIMNALTSMMSDLRKHPETADHAGIQIGIGLMMIGSLSTQHEVRHFIEGFN